MPRKPLLMTAMLMARPSCTMVESSAAVIWKPPSPAMTQTSFSGHATFAPIADSGVTLHGVDLAEPVGVGLLWQQREKKLENFAQVTDEGDVGANVLVDLGGVDFDVDLLRVGR